MVRKLIILNKFAYKDSKGRENYAITYAKVESYEGRNRIALDYKDGVNYNYPFFFKVERKLFDQLAVGDIRTFEFVLDEHDQKIPHITNKLLNVFELIK